MNITLKTTFSMMKKKKLQVILISLIFMLISTMIYLGMSFINQASMYNIMADRANASEDIILFEGIDLMDDYELWWKNHPSVKSFVRYDSIMTETKFEEKDESISETVLLTEYNNDTIDILYLSEDEYVSEPLGNDIYINTNMAKIKNLSKGDTLEINLNNGIHTFIIKEIIVDPHFSTPFNTPNRCFISKSYFSENQLKASHALFGMRYYDGTENHQEIFDNFQETEGQFSQPYYLNKETISMSYNMILNIIGAILLAVSIFLFLVALIIIRFTVKQIILNQYKEIGIKKVLGYTHCHIRNSYLYQFIIMGSVSSILGVLIGFPIRTAINSDLGYDMQVGIKTSIDLYTFLAPLIVVLLISLTTLRIVNKTREVVPLQAIKYGMPERSVHYSKFSIHSKKASIILLLAIKQLFGNKRKTITSILTVSLLIYVAFVISNIGYTLNQDSYMAGYLLGLDIGDFAVQVPTGELLPFVETIEGYEHVETLVYMDMKLGSSVYDQENVLMNIGHMTIYGDQSDIIKLNIGRHPANKTEVVISQVISERTGKATGDYITVGSKTGQDKYLITGVVRSIMNSSLVFFTMEEKLPQKENEDMSVMRFLWGYGRKVDIGELDYRLKNEFGDHLNVSRYDSNVNTILSTLTYFPTVVKTLLLVFVSVCGIIYINITIMDINQDTKVYGIMKSIGYSNFEIIKILLIKSSMLTACGLVFGLVSCLLTMNAIMQGVFNLSPFSSIQLPMLLDIKGIIVLTLVFLLISFIGTLLPSRHISKVSPKQLISG